MPCYCDQPVLARLGHDALGHRLASLLLQHGLDGADAEALGALSDEELLAFPRVGPAALDRVQRAYGAVTTVPTRLRPVRRPARQRPVDGGSCTCSPRLLDLGHDQFGHALSGNLARTLGLFAGDEARLAALSDEELLAVWNLGPAGLTRIREHVPARLRLV